MNDKVNVRMCLTCRQHFNKSELVRIANTGGKAIVDKTHKAGGRGAYICSYKCFEKSIKKNLMEKAVKCHISDEIFNEIKEMWNNGQ